MKAKQLSIGVMLKDQYISQTRLVPVDENYIPLFSRNVEDFIEMEKEELKREFGMALLRYIGAEVEVTDFPILEDDE